MSKTVAYLRASSDGQSTDSQRHAVSQVYKVDKWFIDEATSGTVKANDRPGFKDLLKYIREEDRVVVSAIDRLGRDTIDVLEVVNVIQREGATIVSMREGFDLSTPIGKAMLTMLAAVAELERTNIKARQMAGIQRAKAEGKALGRAKTIDDAEVAQWRMSNNASISKTSQYFGISPASVKRACRKSL